MVRQAAVAVRRSLEGGQLRHRIDFLLPVNEKEFDFMATEPIDYPCSLQKEFNTCCALARLLIEEVMGPNTQVQRKDIGSGGVEGEPCAVLYPSTKDLAAVVFPVADNLQAIRDLAKEEARPLLVINPQWRESGQVISDFGIGPWKARAMEFLDTFQVSYALLEQRVGAPGSVDVATAQRYSSGGVLRILRAYPHQYQVFVMAANGSNQLAAVYPEPPSYQQLSEMLKDARAADMEIFSVASKASNMFGDRNDPSASSSKAAEISDTTAGSPSDSEIDLLDAVLLRKYLGAYGLPASGKISKLRERLKEAVRAKA